MTKLAIINGISMMIEARIFALNKLGELLRGYGKKQQESDTNLNIDEQSIQNIIIDAQAENPWFTPDNILFCLNHWGELLRKDKLEQWVKNTNLSPKDKTIGIVCAGNIPLVGFHDFLCVFILGFKAMVKPSSKDTVLMRFMIDYLLDINPAFSSSILIVDKLKNFDAVIATGSENTARYFEYYFKNYPHIIRKNRTSVAIIPPDILGEEMSLLADDVFIYFGLGCRNATHLLLPKEFDFSKIEAGFEKYKQLGFNNKFANNYDYHKAIFLLNQDIFMDFGFFLMRENNTVFSPIATLYYTYYENEESLSNYIDANKDNIQCIIGRKGENHVNVEYSKSQKPALTDYADHINTLKFLEDL